MDWRGVRVCGGEGEGGGEGGGEAGGEATLRSGGTFSVHEYIHENIFLHNIIIILVYMLHCKLVVYIQSQL